jgi:hypothetical protein
MNFLRRILKMKKTESFDYIVNAGPTTDNLTPLCAYKTKEDAIAGAQRLAAEKISAFKYTEAVYMPEDDIDTNEVVWRSWRTRK